MYVFPPFLSWTSYMTSLGVYRNTSQHLSLPTRSLTLQFVTDPFSLKSLLLAPTEIPATPLGICQLCDTTSHVEKSRRESDIDTIVDWPGTRKMLSKPFRLNGALLAEAGGEVYSCGI